MTGILLLVAGLLLLAAETWLAVSGSVILGVLLAVLTAVTTLIVGSEVLEDWR